MKAVITSLLTNPLSIDVRNAFGASVRVLIAPLSSTTVENVDPWFLNQSKILRRAVYVDMTCTVTFVPEDDDLIRMPAGGDGATVLEFSAESVGTSITQRWLWPDGSGHVASTERLARTLPAGELDLQAVYVSHAEPGTGSGTLTYTLLGTGNVFLGSITVGVAAAGGVATFAAPIVGSTVACRVTKAGQVLSSPVGVVVTALLG